MPDIPCNFFSQYLHIGNRIRARLCMPSETKIMSNDDSKLEREKSLATHRSETTVAVNAKF